MSMAPLLGVPGKLKTLIDRLTATRAANLDDLDTTVSSRASQTSVNTIDSEVGTILGRVPSTVASQASVNTVDTNVDTLLARVPVTVSNSAVSKSVDVETATNGGARYVISLGATYDPAKSLVTVDSPNNSVSSPIGRARDVYAEWAWMPTPNQIYVTLFSRSTGAETGITSSRFTVSVVELN